MGKSTGEKKGDSFCYGFLHFVKSGNFMLNFLDDYNDDHPMEYIFNTRLTVASQKDTKSSINAMRQYILISGVYLLIERFWFKLCPMKKIDKKINFCLVYFLHVISDYWRRMKFSFCIKLFHFLPSFHFMVGHHSCWMQTFQI